MLGSSNRSDKVMSVDDTLGEGSSGNEKFLGGCSGYPGYSVRCCKLEGGASVERAHERVQGGSISALDSRVIPSCPPDVPDLSHMFVQYPTFLLDEGFHELVEACVMAMVTPPVVDEELSRPRFADGSVCDLRVKDW